MEEVVDNGRWDGNDEMGCWRVSFIHELPVVLFMVGWTSTNDTLSSLDILSPQVLNAVGDSNHPVGVDAVVVKQDGTSSASKTSKGGIKMVGVSGVDDNNRRLCHWSLLFTHPPFLAKRPSSRPDQHGTFLLSIPRTPSSQLRPQKRVSDVNLQD